MTVLNPGEDAFGQAFPTSPGEGGELRVSEREDGAVEVGDRLNLLLASSEKVEQLAREAGWRVHKSPKGEVGHHVTILEWS